MTVERKKKKLLMYREIEKRIDLLRKEKERWYIENWYHGTGLGSGLHNVSVEGNGVELTVEKAARANKQIDLEIKKLTDLRLKIEKAIDLLKDPNEMRVIRLLYLGEIDQYGNKRWYDVDDTALKLNYSKRQIYRILKSALQHLPDF